MFLAMLALALAGSADTKPVQKFWEYVRTDTGEDGWTIERRNEDFCQTYTTTKYGYINISWALHEDRAVLSVYSLKTNAMAGAKDSFFVAMKNRGQEAYRFSPQPFASRQNENGKWEAATAFSASALRSAIIKGDQIWVVKDNSAIFRAMAEHNGLIFNSLDACLANKTRS